ncbi:MAG: alpha/beta hydrolase [Burkholderiales bacterium]|nr:MAG: alpha/beta hydrolase [Burkholderiales bacterium]
MAYWSWGSSYHQHVVLCVHGLARQGLDFDVLAQKLIGEDGKRCRVVSVDVAGRGMSDWLSDPQLYQVPQYATDIVTLLMTLKAQGAQTIDWVGTSMGGLIGIAVAAQTVLQPQLAALKPRKLILNDIGPVVQWAALQRISGYLGADKRFASEQEAIDYLSELSVSFGPHTPEQWRALCRPMIRPDMTGAGISFKLHYDPAVAVPVRATTPESAAQAEALLWQLYDAITSETLLIRGAQSDLITLETAQQMQVRGPKAKLVQFEGVGHAPMLVQPEQTLAVEDFLFGA